MSKTSLEAVSGGLAFRLPYDASAVEVIKEMIPAADRSWTGQYWLVKPEHADTLVSIAEMLFGEMLTIPTLQPAVGKHTFTVEYLGRCTTRSGASLAWGWADGTWSVCITEQALRTWFADNPIGAPKQAATLYQVLGVAGTVSQDDLRSAYRRMARQWHPDVCHEADATERFKQVQAAWERLSQPVQRKKYDAGLLFEAAARKAEQPKQQPYHPVWYYGKRQMPAPDEYRSPLRCGKVAVHGEWRLGKFYADAVLAWDDITDAAGRVMVSSWPVGASHFQVSWR